MTTRSVLSLLATVALVGCGEQVTQAPSTPPATAERPATPPATTPPATTGQTTPPATSGQATTPSGGTGTATTGVGAAAASLAQYQGQTYSAGPVSVRLNPDNTFVMTETDGNRKVEGRYTFQNGVITFSDPKGDTGTATFPMRCRFESSGNQFTLGAVEGSCERFKGLTFRPA